MLSSHLLYMIAQQRITERHRAAARDRAARPIRDPRGPDTNAGRASLRRLRPRDCK